MARYTSRVRLRRCDRRLRQYHHAFVSVDAGDVDIAVPTGACLPDRDVGASDVSTIEVFRDDPADAVISACVRTGDLTIRARD